MPGQFQNPLLGYAPGAGFGGAMPPSNALLPPNPYQVTPAEGWAANAQAAGNYIAQQRAESVRQGLMDPNTGLPTRAGVVNAAGQVGNALLMGTTEPGAPPVNGLLAYHGTPYSFDRFSLDKVGTGEGAQAFGHGLYFAQREGVARSYRDAVTRNKSGAPDLLNGDGQPFELNYDYPDPHQLDAYGLITSHKGNYDAAIADANAPNAIRGWNADRSGNVTDALNVMRDSGATYGRPTGHMYQVQINANPDHLLDWDKPLSDQHPVVQGAMAQHLEPYRQQLISDALPTWRDPTPDELAQTHAQANDAIGALKGGQAYDKIAGSDPAGASQALQASGVPGLRYLDQGSRGGDGGAGDPSHNLVVFDDNTINILKKYGIAGLGIGGAAAAQSQAPSSGAGTDQTVTSQTAPAQQLSPPAAQ